MTKNTEKMQHSKKEIKSKKTKTIKKKNPHLFKIQELREKINVLETNLATEQNKVSTLEEHLHQEKNKNYQPRVEAYPNLILSKRATLKPNRRKRIITKQLNKCNLCKVELSPTTATIGHILALKFGGGNEDGNLQALCDNRHKHKNLLEKTYETHLRHAIFLKPILQQIFHV